MFQSRATSVFAGFVMHLLNISRKGITKDHGKKIYTHMTFRTVKVRR